jgi:hypothetical protein
MSFKSLLIFFSLVVSAFVFNQSRGHLLFSNALHVTITMALDLKEKSKMAPSMVNLEDEMVVVWSCLCLFLTLKNKYVMF